MISESKRTLAAVMFTDIVGYTAMMHSDENLELINYVN
jgi:class 3 adenylate cyclase